MDLSDRGNQLNDGSVSSRHSVVSVNDEADILDDTFPELRSPQGRFVRPENDEEDYKKRSPDGKKRRAMMKKAIPGLSLDESESESLSQSYRVVEEGIVVDDNHKSNATLTTEPSNNNLLGTINNDDDNTDNKKKPFCGRNMKICCAFFGFIVFTLSIFAAGIIIGLETAPYVENLGADTSNPSTNQGSTTTDRFSDLAYFIAEHGWATERDLTTEGTPANAACDWLAHTDPLQITVDAGYTSLELQKRFLLALVYYSLNGKEWHQQMNFLSAKPACKWNEQFNTEVGIPVQVGVSCKEDNVRELYFPKNNLQGEFPAAFGLFTELVELNLFDNAVTGVLPSELTALTKLESLVAHNNDLQGPIPAWIGELTALRTLNLSNNGFTGNLPASFSATLETLALERNDLTGKLDSLQGLAKLKALYLGDNRFSGELSDEVLGSWTVIEILDLSDNLISGSIPATLFVQKELTVVDLHGNNFSGHLPDLIGMHDSIEFLALQENQLEGPIDDRLFSLTNLQHLDLSSNFFSGDFPYFLSQMTKLKYLFLAFNENLKLGSIPTEFGQLTNLVDLSLQHTNRIGAIPSELGALENLVLLDLNDNVLEGPVPASLGSLANLKFLLLKENNLQGELPATFSQLSQLDTLLLDGNSITGGADAVCAQNNMLTTFSADCSELLDSHECVTQCCSDTNDECKSEVWFSDLDPVATGNYARDHYMFHEDDIIYPVEPAAAAEDESSYYDNYDGYSSVGDKAAAFEDDDEEIEDEFPDSENDYTFDKQLMDEP